MTPQARIAAAAEILDLILAGDPAERALTGWARRSRFAGSKDRAAVRDHVFDALRCRRSLALLGGAETGRGLMLGLLRATGGAAETVFTGEGHAPAPLSAAEAALAARPVEPELAAAPDPVACDMPDWLWPLWTASLGAQSVPVAMTLRDRAPVFLRVNLRKATVDQALAALAAEGIAARPHPLAATALEVVEGARRIVGSAAFAGGLVELQDAASQAVTAALPLRPGARVLDYCAGGGGKTLAMAGRVAADYTAHDAAPARLRDLPARAARAGVRVTLAEAPRGPFDLVLCDVPCSGSGAWRRAPDGKWSLTPGRLEEIGATQAEILATCAPLVAPGGTLAYATCSVLAVENGDRVAGFLAAHPDWQLAAERQWLPGEGGDGFYLAQLTRKPLTA